MRLLALTLVAFCVSASPAPALAWGDEGHKVVALIAERFLAPAVRSKVQAILAADPDSLTPHDIASEATWADKYRDEDKRRAHYAQTHLWHFVDIELNQPDVDTACYGHPRISGVASNGPAKDCIVDKIDQFAAELRNPATDAEERTMALKFLLHFIGDLHQPLHASDNHDQGGNSVKVSGPPPGFNKRSNLHATWDTTLVQRIRKDPRQVADEISDSITRAQATAWAQGNAAGWALESFGLARTHVYRLPREGAAGVVVLDQAYVDDGVAVVHEQLAKAGVRLAAVLNATLGDKH